jgi:SAM-dependent methyltransferase
MSLRERGLQRRAERALDRQLEYQQKKSAKLKGREQGVVASMIADSAAVRRKLEQVRPIPEEARILEVGSGAHGLIFYFGAKDGVGVDPLADHYSELFPAWQDRARTIAAPGERLPFADACFDVILCDNVVDHAENPRQILEEIARVMAPGAILYFEVNIHHPFYHMAATMHAGWRALGIPFEITPFADHTVHLTRDAARSLFKGLPLRMLEEIDDIETVKREVPAIRHAGDRLKRLFFKNAKYEVIAVREAARASA